MKKHKVIETLEQLPEEFNLEELVEKLIFLEKVERGLNDAATGNTMTLDEAKSKLMQEWEASK